MRALFITGALFAFTAAACVSTPDSSESAGDEAVGTSEAAIKLSEITTVPAYFGIDNHFTPNGDDPWIYAQLRAYKGKNVTATVSAGADGASVGFKLYRVLPNDMLKLTDTVDGPSGEATLSFTSKGTGVYVIEMVTSASFSDLSLRLDCDGGNCSPDPEPGDFCGGLIGATCPEGLYCAYAPEASCGAGDQSGVCARKPQICIELYAPVCGCDGLTHGNACKAASAGVSVAYDGECVTP